MTKQSELTDNSYKLTPQNIENIFNVYTNDDGFYFYNILKTVIIPEDLDSSCYTEYTTLTHDTYMLISYKFYGDIKLWWLICTTNQINNAIELPIPGTVLKILNVNVVKSILATIAKSN